jgi:hypothetical protein
MDGHISETKLEPEYPDAKRPTTYVEGMEFEDFAREKCIEIGLFLTRFSSRKYQFERGDGRIDEIKLDNRFLETGRLSIEIAEKSRAGNRNFVPSGIYAGGDFWLYIHGNYDLIFIFSRKTLQKLHRFGVYPIHEKSTIITFYIPIEDAFEHCEVFIPVSDKGRAIAKKWS